MCDLYRNLNTSSYIFILGIKNGQYSLHFAGNESLRLYYYQERTLVFNAYDHPIERSSVKEDHNSVSITPNFPAFRDCMDYVLTMNSSYQRSFGRKNEIIQSESEILKNRIKCQFFQKSNPELIHRTLDNVTLTPGNSEECTWNWIKDENNAWGGVFNVTMHKTKQHIINASEVIHPSSISEENVTLALTCATCFSEHCILSPIDHMLGNFREPAVTFAIPFVLKNKTFIGGNTLVRHPNVKPFAHYPVIIAVVVTVSFLLLVVLIIGGYQYIKRKTDKR